MHDAIVVGRNFPSQVWKFMPSFASACCMPTPNALRIGAAEPIGTYQTVLPLTALTPETGLSEAYRETSPANFARSAWAEAMSVLAPAVPPDESAPLRVDAVLLVQAIAATVVSARTPMSRGLSGVLRI